VFADGTRARAAARHARGNPDLPLSDAERLAKVRACVAPALGDSGAERLITAVDGLESLGDARALARCTA